MLRPTFGVDIFSFRLTPAFLLIGDGFSFLSSLLHALGGGVTDFTVEFLSIFPIRGDITSSESGSIVLLRLCAAFRGVRDLLDRCFLAEPALVILCSVDATSSSL